MKRNYTLGLLCLVLQMGLGQSLVVSSKLASSTTVRNGDLLVVSTLGETLAGVTQHNEIIFSSEPFPYLFLSESTGIQDLPPIEGMKVHPNPALQEITIHRTSTAEKLLVKMIHSDGKVVLEKQWDNAELKMQLSIESFSNGIYFISVIDEKQMKASQFKMVKM